MNDVILAIDIGTTNIKCVVARRNMQFLADAECEYKTHSPEFLFYEQDCEDWWTHCKLAISRALAKAGTSAADVAAIAVSAQAPTFLPVARDGSPLCPAMIWMDRRSDRQCRRMELDFGREAIFRATGNVPDPFYFTIAIGMTFVILIGGIDLSVGSITALTGMLVAILMKTYNWNVALAVTVSMLAACGMGLINGALIAGLNLPPFIMTLGMMEIARGLSYSVTAGQPIYTLPEGFLAISGRINNIPLVAILIMLILFLIAFYVLRYTRFGRYVYAVGGNESCAKLSGINVKAVKVAVYTISGFCCGVAAMLLTSRLDSAVPTNAEGYEMNAIAAAVIGGVSMSGGEGSLVGTIIGAFMIGVIANGMNLLVIPTGPQRVVTGAIIVLAVILDVVRKGAANKAK